MNYTSTGIFSFAKQNGKEAKWFLYCFEDKENENWTPYFKMETIGEVKRWAAGQGAAGW